MIPQVCIAHYRITAKLGEGGMGAVYRAQDTKLNREVAVKVLPSSFAGDPDRLARFEREAQVLASLNHPNIAAIYGVEERAIVMELVEGDTLAAPVPLEEALQISLQIAHALEYAHLKGVVHRDLKPANIKITPEGVVKVLDFGLAKALSTEDRTADPASSPTLTMRATMAGLIMGTAAYMSPEQARGHAVDKRADVWAFGVVLYEMLTGRQCFAGETVSDTLASVLKSDPDWSALPERTPPAIRRLLRRCLARDRKKRLCDIGDARLEIEEALSGAPEPSFAPPPPVGQAVHRAWFAAVAVLGLAGLALAFVHFREQPPTEPAVVRFQIPVDPSVSRISLSPDGRRLAFTAVDGTATGRTAVWIRALDSLDIRQLSIADFGSGLFWSADSRSIGFVSDGRLKRIDISGGTPQALCNITGTVPGGAWNKEGTILFGSVPNGGGLYRVAETGGDAVRVTTSDSARRETAHMFPQFLPDGRHFIFLGYSTDLESRAIQLGSLNGDAPKRLIATHLGGVYAPARSRSGNGHILFLRDGTLLAQPFNTYSLNPVGQAFPVAEHVASRLGYGFFSASGTGTLVYRQGSAEVGNRQLTWFDRSGKRLGDVGPLAGYSDVALSPDGKVVAVSRTAVLAGTRPNRDIWLMDARGMATRFTTDPADDVQPTWSPDGKRIVFSSGRVGAGGLYEKSSTGVESERLLLKTDAPALTYSLSPDGRFLLYGVNDPKNRIDLWILPLAGDRKPEPFLATPFNEALGQFSPVADGGRYWVAFTSDESGSFEVYVESYPRGSGKYLVSKGGGTQARWRPDGKELFYVAPGGVLMAVDVRTAPQFQSGVPRPLFQTRINLDPGPSGPPGFRYSVGAGGNRFLVNADTQPPESTTPLTVVLNWDSAAMHSSASGR